MEYRHEPKPSNDLGSQGELSLLGKKKENGREKNLERRVDEHPCGSILAAGVLFVQVYKTRVQQTERNQAFVYSLNVYRGPTLSHEAYLFLRGYRKQIIRRQDTFR